jgi:long-chain acyl-CoA synthetase
MPVDTIPHRLINQANIRPNAAAYHFRTPEGWQQVNYKDYAEQVQNAAKSLMAMGFSPGDSACIIGFNRAEWCIMDVATMMAGGLAAGIYTTCSPQEVAYIVNHAEAAFILIEDKAQWEKLDAERANLPKLKHIITMKDCESIDDSMVISWADFLAKGKDKTASELKERMDAIQSESLATLIYTSGTTGPPKGVMLSHANLTWTATAAVGITESNPSDYSLSYLPLCHIAEQMFSIHAPITAGYSVYFAQSMEQLPENLKEVQPSVFFGVPRVYEKFYDGVSSKLALAPPRKAKLVAWAQNVGQQVNDLRNDGQNPGLLLNLKYKFARKLIYRKLHEAIGMKNARFLVTGAAPINPEIQRFFSGFDLVIREVYGQSEDCGPTSFNIPGRTRFGTVGPAFPGVSIKIADDGEILVKGPNVFMGYYKEEKATNDTLAEGWLYSGDLGSFDGEGYLTITGRKKDIIITAGGKNIAPKNIEAAIQHIKGVSQAVVIGDRRKFLSALITLTPEALEQEAAAHGVEPNALPTTPAFLTHLQQGIDGVNSQFARVEHIRKFVVLPREFTVEDSELTPTLKIKRRIVNDNWSEEIENMYS